MNQVDTLGKLKETGYKPLGVKAEMRKNLVQKMLDREPLFPGIHGLKIPLFPRCKMPFWPART